MWSVLFASLGESSKFSFQAYTELFLVVMFVSNGLSGGVLVSVPELRNIALCYRRQ